MNPIKLINKYYRDAPEAKRVLLRHSKQVANMAVTIAKGIRSGQPVDIKFVEEAALLHDIGMLFTDTPQLGCQGEKPYIVHGVLGAEMLIQEGLPHHARVCERHIGVGLSRADITEQKLPLPQRDMAPETVEEKIIAYADLFFSKTRPGQRTVKDVRHSLSRYGSHKVDIFDEWHEVFAIES